MKSPRDNEKQAASPSVDVGDNELSGEDCPDLDQERRWFFNFKKDPENYERIYAEFSPAISSFLLRRTDDIHIAEDLTQDTFVRALSGVGKFEWRGISLRAYFFKVAHNVYNDWHKKKMKRGETTFNIGGMDVSSGESSDATVQQEDDKAILLACMAHLTGNQREAIDLFYWSGLRAREVAVIMKISEAAVQSHLHRGRVALKQQLDDQGFDSDSFSLLSVPHEKPTWKDNFWTFIDKKSKGYTQ